MSNDTGVMVAEEESCVPVNTSTQHYRKRKEQGMRVICPVCSKDFASYSKNNYKTHMLGHLPEEELPFACGHEGCSRRFAQKKNMLKHAEKCGIAPKRKRNKTGPSEEEAKLARAELVSLQLDMRSPGLCEDPIQKKV